MSVVKDVISYPWTPTRAVGFAIPKNKCFFIRLARKRTAAFKRIAAPQKTL